MGISAALSFLPVIGKFLDKGLDVVDAMVEDKDKANEIKAAVRRQIMEEQHKELLTAIESQTKIILAEARGGALQRNWRPLLMLTVVFILFNNYVLAPYIAAIWPGTAVVLDLPSGLWALLNVGVGGYVVGRSAEKIIPQLPGRNNG